MGCAVHILQPAIWRSARPLGPPMYRRGGPRDGQCCPADAGTHRHADLPGAFLACTTCVFLKGRVKFGALRANRRQEAASHGSALFGFGVDLEPLVDLGAIAKPVVKQFVLFGCGSTMKPLNIDEIEKVSKPLTSAQRDRLSYGPDWYPEG